MNWFIKRQLKKLINKGYDCYHAKDYELAIEYFEQAKSIDSNWFVPYFNIGVCYSDMDNLEKALESLNQALNLEPNAENCLFNKIIVLNNLGRKEKALENSFRLLELNEMEEGYLNFHGYLLFNLKRYPEAIKVYEKLNELFSEGANYKITLASCYSRMNNPLKSIEICQEILVDNPENATALNNMGFNRLALGEFEKAMIDLNRSIVLDPDFAFAYNNRGFAFLKLGELEKAILDIEHSLKLDDKNPFVYKNKGLYFLEINDKVKAKENLLKARELGFKEKYGDEVDVLLKQLEE